MASSSSTRGEEVFQRIKGDLVGGVFEPGSKLPFAMLTERYGASASVIREGLSRLVEQGLVRSEPQQGYRVAPVSVEDLDDLVTARCAVETQALKLSIEHGDLHWESSLVAVHHCLERTPLDLTDYAGSQNDPWTVVHRRYHEVLLEGCPSKRLVSVAMALRDSGELYRRWSQPLEEGGTRPVADEHRSITQAVLDRDATRACRLLDEHIRLTARMVALRCHAERSHAGAPQAGALHAGASAESSLVGQT